MRRRVVFVEPVSAGEFAEFAEASSWADTGDRSSEELVWVTADGNEVHWIDDPVLHLVYAMVIGAEPAVVEGRIRVAFDNLTIDEAVAAFRAAAEWPERVEALAVVAAVAADTFDARIFDAVTAGLSDDNKVVRHQAVLAVFYARWPEFLPALRHVVANDPYEEARTVAETAIETIEHPELYPYPG